MLKSGEVAAMVKSETDGILFAPSASYGAKPVTHGIGRVTVDRTMARGKSRCIWTRP